MLVLGMSMMCRCVLLMLKEYGKYTEPHNVNH